MHTFAGDTKALMFGVLGLAPHKKAVMNAYDTEVNKREGKPWVASESIPTINTL